MLKTPQIQEKESVIKPVIGEVNFKEKKPEEMRVVIPMRTVQTPGIIIREAFREIEKMKELPFEQATQIEEMSPIVIKKK